MMMVLLEVVVTDWIKEFLKTWHWFQQYNLIIYHLIRIGLKKMLFIQRLDFSTFKIGGKISLFIKMDFFLGLLLLLDFPLCVSH